MAGQQAGTVAAFGGIETELRLDGQTLDGSNLYERIAAVHHVAIVHGVAFQYVFGVVHVARAPKLMRFACLGIKWIPVAREVGGERRE